MAKKFTIAEAVDALYELGACSMDVEEIREYSTPNKAWTGASPYQLTWLITTLADCKDEYYQRICLTLWAEKLFKYGLKETDKIAKLLDSAAVSGNLKIKKEANKLLKAAEKMVEKELLGECSYSKEEKLMGLREDLNDVHDCVHGTWLLDGVIDVPYAMSASTIRRLVERPTEEELLRAISNQQ